MAPIIGDDGVTLIGQNPVIYPSDGTGRQAAVLAGFHGDDILYAAFTDDGKLRVDASVTIETVDIGDVGLFVRDSSGTNHLAGGILNPDSLTWALYTQDPRFTFSSNKLLVDAGSISLSGNVGILDSSNVRINPAKEDGNLLSVKNQTDKLKFSGRDLYVTDESSWVATDTSIARDSDGLVQYVYETDGVRTKTSTIIRDTDGNVTDITEAVV